MTEKTGALTAGPVPNQNNAAPVDAPSTMFTGCRRLNMTSHARRKAGKFESKKRREERKRPFRV